MKKYPSTAAWQDIDLSDENFQLLEKRADVRFDVQAREAVQRAVNDYVADLAFYGNAADRDQVKKHLEKVEKHAGALAGLIYGGEDRHVKSAALNLYLPLSVADPREFTAFLSELVLNCKLAIRDIKWKGEMGPPSNTPRAVLIDKLLDIWAAAEGRGRGHKWDPYVEACGGPFLAFVHEILSLAGTAIRRGALRKAIQKRLSLRK